MSTADFAFAQRQMGRSMVQRLANAQVTFGDGLAAVRISAVLRRRAAQAPVGDYLRATTRDISLSLLTEDLGATVVADGSRVAVYPAGQSTVFNGYRVANGGRVDDTDTGVTTLELEAP